MGVAKYCYYLSSVGRLLAGIENLPLVARVFLKAAPPGVHAIRLRRSKIRLRVRGAMDVWIVKETFLDRFYERYGTPVQDGWTVLDVGAGIGDYSILAGHGRPATRVYAFEPFPESFALLRENLQLNDVANVRAYAEAIGGQTGTLWLDLSSGEPLQFGPRGAGDSAKALAVSCLSLADAFHRLALAHCDLLKMDCEGAEYEILFRAPGSVLEQIDRIVMETHDGVTQFTCRDLIPFLTGLGYRVRVRPNPVHAHLGFLYACR